MLHELLQELQLVQELQGLYPAGTDRHRGSHRRGGRQGARRHGRALRPGRRSPQVRRRCREVEGRGRKTPATRGTGGPPPLQKDLRPLNAESFKTAFKRWAGLGAGCKGEREAQVPAAGGDAGRRREDGRGGGPAAPAVPADLRPRQPAVQLHHAHGRRRFPAVGQEPLLLHGTEEGAQLRPALPPPNAPPRRDCDPRKRGTVGGPFSQKSTVLEE